MTISDERLALSQSAEVAAVHEAVARLSGLTATLHVHRPGRDLVRWAQLDGWRGREYSEAVPPFSTLETNNGDVQVVLFVYEVGT